MDYSTRKAQARNLLLCLMCSGNTSLYHNIRVFHVIPLSVQFTTKSTQDKWTFCSFKTFREKARALSYTEALSNRAFFFASDKKKKRSLWNYEMDVNHYLTLRIRTSFMEYSNSKWWPPSVEFFYPLMQHSSWTNNHCWTQSLVPKIEYSKKKPLMWNK